MSQKKILKGLVPERFMHKGGDVVCKISLRVTQRSAMKKRRRDSTYAMFFNA